MPNDLAVQFSDLGFDHQALLAELSVFNWGSYSGLHTAPFSANGTLVTGDTGVGKSSLADALQPLLMRPSAATFNTAAAKSSNEDRSLISYLRGKFKNTASDDDKGGGYSRPGPTVTGIRALYRVDDTFFTLAALFWLKSPSTSLGDVQRAYVVARRNQPLKDLLSALKTPWDVKSLEAEFSDDDAVTVYRTFDPYFERARDLLKFDNPNASALLVRAMGLKEIPNLTHMIQTVVLDPQDATDEARLAVRAFEDIESTYSQYQDLLAQQAVLAPLDGLDADFRACAEERLLVDRRERGLPVFVARELQRLWSARIDRLNQDADSAKAEHASAVEALRRDEDGYLAAHATYMNAGGGAIQQLEKAVEIQTETRNKVVRSASEYCRLGGKLGLRSFADADSYAQNQRDAHAELGCKADALERAAEKWGEALANKTNSEKQRDATERELIFARKRGDTAISEALSDKRDEIAAAVGLAPGSLPFVAELIDVAPAHEAWRGAIERALGKNKVTMLIPDDGQSEAAVRAYVNHNDMKQDIRFRVARPRRNTVAFPPRGYLSKLIFKEHTFKGFVREFLHNQDLTCVDSEAEMQAQAYSLTIEGLIQRAKGHYEKLDGRPLTAGWCIGFSNRLAVERLQVRLAELKGEREAAKTNAEALKGALDNLDNRFKALELLTAVQWTDIDVEAAEARLKEDEGLLARARAARGDLKIAEEALEQAKARRTTSLEKERAADLAKSTIAGRLTDAKTKHALASTAAQAPVDPLDFEAAAGSAPPLIDADADSPEVALSERQSPIRQALTRLSRRGSELSEQIAGIISSYATSWPVIAGEWGQSVADRTPYLEKLHELNGGAINALTARLEEKMNVDGTRFFVAVQNQIANINEEIRNRVSDINVVLRRTEFRFQTHLQLVANEVSYDLNRRFSDLVRTIKSLSTSTDYAARYDAIRQTAEILRNAIDPRFSDNKANLRLLHPRHQFDFVALELCKVSGAEKDRWSSSSGKSGGEKEIFAGNIVAASLAYVLTPLGSSRPYYASIFLDEAFSNASSVYSTKTLQAFKELGLLPNLITPFKNLSLARECADSIIMVNRPQDNPHCSLAMVDWNYVDRRLAKTQARVDG